MIKQNVKSLLSELPKGVLLEAAAKTRNAEQILEAVDAGIEIIGENYVQEAEAAFAEIGPKVKWHFIGHLQGNKVKRAVKIFDMIETVDSQVLAEEIDKFAGKVDKLMPVLIEVNSAQEQQKFGVVPEHVEQLIRQISRLKNIKVMGLMTMGPVAGDPEDARAYFSQTKKIFDHCSSLGLTQVQMRYLSMGMTNSYQVAIEEGANIVRLGSKIFGPRD